MYTPFAGGLDFIQRVKIWNNTMTLCGLMTDKNSQGAPYYSMKMGMEHMSTISQCVPRFGPKQAVVADETLRRKMAYYASNQRLTAGAAMLQSLREMNNMFTTPIALCAKDTPRNPGSPRSPRVGPKKDDRKKPKLDANKLKTARVTSSGKNVCRARNGDRGCRNRRCKFGHVCDVEVAPGKACGAAHTRGQHR